MNPTLRKALTGLAVPVLVVALSASSCGAKKACDPQDKKIWGQCTRNILDCPCEMNR